MNFMIGKKAIDSVESSALVIEKLQSKFLINPAKLMTSLVSNAITATNLVIRVKLVGNYMANLQIERALNNLREIPINMPLDMNGGMKINQEKKNCYP